MRQTGDGRARQVVGILALAAVLLVVPAVAWGQAGGSVSGLLVRVQGDLALDEGESADLVVVVSGDADVRGRAGAVIVVGGTARLLDARVGRLVVVRGTAELDGSSRVLGDVFLLSARLEQGSEAKVGGSVQHGYGAWGWRWAAGAPVLAVGALAVLLLASVLAVAVGAGTMRRAADELSGDFAGALGWALLLFLVAPAVAVLLFFTVLGLPLSLVYLVGALPVLGLAGCSVAALSLGRWMLRSRSPRPYGAAALGVATLAAVGLVPFAGQVLVPLAGALGAGALAATARRAYVGEAAGSPADEGG